MQVLETPALSSASCSSWLLAKGTLLSAVPVATKKKHYQKASNMRLCSRWLLAQGTLLSAVPLQQQQ